MYLSLRFHHLHSVHVQGKCPNLGRPISEPPINCLPIFENLCFSFWDSWDVFGASFDFLAGRALSGSWAAGIGSFWSSCAQLPGRGLSFSSCLSESHRTNEPRKSPSRESKHGEATARLMVQLAEARISYHSTFCRGGCSGNRVQ